VGAREGIIARKSGGSYRAMLGPLVFHYYSLWSDTGMPDGLKLCHAFVVWLVVVMWRNLQHSGCLWMFGKDTDNAYGKTASCITCITEESLQSVTRHTVWNLWTRHYQDVIEYTGSLRVHNPTTNAVCCYTCMWC